MVAVERFRIGPEFILERIPGEPVGSGLSKAHAVVVYAIQRYEYMRWPIWFALTKLINWATGNSNIPTNEAVDTTVETAAPDNSVLRLGISSAKARTSFAVLKPLMH